MSTSTVRSHRSGVLRWRIWLLSIVTAVVAVAVVAASGATSGPEVTAAASTSRYVPVGPTRLVDTRSGAPVQANVPRDFQITGSVVPADATAVVLNVTATESAGPGYLQVFPTGRAAPGSSSTLNVGFSGETMPNAAFAPLGDGGRVSVFATFTTDVLIDVFGYFVPASSATSGRLVPVRPSRILDTRSGIGVLESPPTAWQDPIGTGNAAGLVPGGATISLPVAGRGGVPSSGASAVVMNVTVVSPTASGFVQVAPTPVVRGAFSNLNPEVGRTTANLVVVPLGAGGQVDLYAQLNQPGTLDLLADVVGYFTDDTAENSSAGLFVPITPTRALDTRQPAPQPEVTSGTIVDVDVATIAPGASAIAGNLTSTGGDPGGYLQLAATPVAPGTASSLNTSYENQTIANAVVSPVAAGGAQVFSFGPTHILLDVTGWFTDVPPPRSDLDMTDRSLQSPVPQPAGSPTSGSHLLRMAGGPTGYGRWGPCDKVITFAVNAERATQLGIDAMFEAIRAIESATGFDLKPYRSNPLTTLGLQSPYNVNGADALIAFSDETATPNLAGLTSGIGGGSWIPAQGRAVSGFAIVDVADSVTAAEYLSVFTHELGHMIGLGHVNDPTEIMYPVENGLTTLGPGDREGLWRLGTAQPCFPAALLTGAASEPVYDVIPLRR